MAGRISGDVFPSLKVHNLFDCESGNTVSPSKVSISNSGFAVGTAYFSYLIFGQFRLSVVLAFLVHAATFLNAIIRIVFLGSQEEMIRPNTWRIVALVQNAKPWRDGANGKLVRKNMCPNNAPLIAKCAVAVIIAASCPLPAVAGLVHFRPESLMKRFCSLAVRVRTVFTVRVAAESVAVLDQIEIRDGFGLLASVAGFFDSGVSHSVQSPKLNGLVRLGQRSNAVQAVFILA